MALGSGVRFMLDAIPAGGGTRTHDLDRARAAFVEPTFLDVQVSASRGGLTISFDGQQVRDAYRSFVMRAGQAVRIGPLTIEVREGQADTPGGFPAVPFRRGAAIGRLRGQPVLPEFHLAVTAAPTLPVPLSSAADHGSGMRGFSERVPTYVLDGGTAGVKVHLPDRQPGERRRLTIFPEHNVRPLIEVWLD